MFSHTDRQRRTRRGVVLILVLGMIGLLALIAVTFASYSGQAESNARNFAQAQVTPDPSRLMDYALAQLIDDTDNPSSVIRGHSLRADMYGNDAFNNGFLDAHPGNGSTLAITNSQDDPSAPALKTWLRTNIPINDSSFSGYNFNNWTLRLGQSAGVLPARIASIGQSFEIFQDSGASPDPAFTTFANNFRVFVVNKTDVTTFASDPFTAPGATATIGLAQPPTAPGVPFILDGRYRQAFNGPGRGQNARYPNFRVNGPLLGGTTATGNPNAVGMDEDYDACDLENWFLAIQSADGHIVVPSFHRPGILRFASATNNDWVNQTADSSARILRPRTADGHSPEAFPDLTPDATGKVRFDVDNDGDGVSDAVWLDLGYPASRNATGQLMKPLFAFTVIGLNGRIPLNTAGNMQKRDPSGVPLNPPEHATHLGNSPSEVDPRYALQNAFGAAQNDGYARVDFTQLRNLLTGTRPAGTGNGDANSVTVGGQTIAMPNNIPDGGDTSPIRSTPPVAGRWGDAEFVPRDLTDTSIIPIRAGRSQTAFLNNRDDNFNAFDPVTTGDYYDVDTNNDGTPDAGAMMLPAQRNRRGVTPTDVAGDGLVTRWSTTDALGADAWGRVSFFKYFRPPGAPGELSYNATTNPPSTSVGAAATAPATPNTNPYRGYESFRDPGVVAPMTPLLAGGMSAVGDPNSPGIDEANEMNLYNPGPYDAPFGPSDLEWLYRKHDTDGASLDSRLARLAPVSFTNPVDGIRRRRLFSIDSWELNQFVWANDDPADDILPDHINGRFPNNSRFTAPADVVPTGELPRTNTGFPALGLVDPANSANFLRPQPVAHRDRKINLNFPLPVSNDPKEPVRQKWIRETYLMLKAVLPPKAVDTPDELAKLSQFVVNIVDFRDTDCTVTRFVNTDLTVTQDTTTSQLFLMPASPPAADPFSPRLEVSDTPRYLIQHGMEYSPIAINEVLAYKFWRKEGTAATESSRLVVELVNTLMEPAGASPLASNLRLDDWDLVIMPDDATGRPETFSGQIPLGAPGGATIREIPLAGVVVDALKATADPTNGPNNHYVVRGPLVSGGTALVPDVPTHEENPITAGTFLENLTLTSGPVAAPVDLVPGNYYWLYLRRPANPLDTAYVDTDPVQEYNRRVVVDSFRFIFRKSETPEPKPATSAPVPVVPEYLFSLQRLQPYRGGHAVSTAPPTTPTTTLPAYGYSEQTAPAVAPPTTGGPWSPTLTPLYGKYGTEATSPRSTDAIYHTMGQRNVGEYYVTGATATFHDDWAYVPFNDRDFTSVAELLMVPGCPPGLFTKSFIEKAPRIDLNAVNEPAPPAASINPNPTTPPPTSARPPTPTGYGPRPTLLIASEAPPTYPYLVDNFYYTGISQFEPPPPPQPITRVPPIPARAAGAPIDGGPSGAGWFKMLGLFDVPSPVMGAIGTMSQGQNFDWFRQDLKPGLLNLNLVIDDEVFASLMGEIPGGEIDTGATLPAELPEVVTQVDANETPTSSYVVKNLGYLNGGSNALKAAFRKFLIQRHGGSGYLFALGRGQVGDRGATLTPGRPRVAAERPYHDLTYPDINYTVMRPASLPPSENPNVLWNPVPPWEGGPALANLKPPGFQWDPGVKNPYIFAENYPVQPPPIPPRRLLQVPDITLPVSNASATGDPYVNSYPTALITNLASSTVGGGAGDRRSHPYFRSEWMQKVTNLTTVRTHQYAVWVTVGFFEVTRQGTPSLAANRPDLAHDILGEEIGLRAGRNVRHRSFFIVDRTKLFGRTATAQDTFNNAVLYRRRIQ